MYRQIREALGARLAMGRSLVVRHSSALWHSCRVQVDCMDDRRGPGLLLGHRRAVFGLVHLGEVSSILLRSAVLLVPSSASRWRPEIFRSANVSVTAKLPRELDATHEKFIMGQRKFRCGSPLPVTPFGPVPSGF